jgi:hypothetical protein
MIVETTWNALYRVEETNDPNLAHCWIGVAVKHSKGSFVPKAKARRELVRKEGCKIIGAGA